VFDEQMLYLQLHPGLVGLTHNEWKMGDCGDFDEWRVNYPHVTAKDAQSIVCDKAGNNEVKAYFQNPEI
jgi:hypothetical protein